MTPAASSAASSLPTVRLGAATARTWAARRAPVAGAGRPSGGRNRSSRAKLEPSSRRVSSGEAEAVALSASSNASASHETGVQRTTSMLG